MKLRFALPVVLAFTLSGLGFAQADNADNKPTTPPPLTAELKKEILDGVKDILEKRAFVPGVDFKKWDELVAKYQESFDKAENEQQFTGAVNRAIREFGISHVGLRTPRSAQARRGSGVTVAGHGLTAEKTAEGLKIVAVVKESPAEAAGLKPGDVIMLINGEPAKDAAAIPTTAGTPVTLTVLTDGGKERTVPLVAKQFVTSTTDELTWFDEDTAIIRIKSFSQGYERANIEKMVTEASKAKRILIDLRSNGGGAVSNLGHLLGLFIPNDKPVGTFVNRGNVTEYQAATKDTTNDVLKIAEWSTRKFRPTANRNVKAIFGGKVAVLINRGSASASEIFAAAMQDVAGAKVVGADSRGAVLASTYGRLPGGYELQYPVSDYVTIKGKRLEGNPVKVDVAATGRTVDGSDAVIAAAVKAISD